MNNFFADIHCHNSVRPFRSSLNPSELKNIWENLPERPECDKIPSFLKELFKETTRFSQANLNKCIEGNVRLVFNSLYSVEKKWYSPIVENIDVKPIDQFMARLTSCLSGFDSGYCMNEINKIQHNAEVNYFDDLIKEIEFVFDNENLELAENKKLVIADNADTIKNAIADNNTIAMVLTIEGAQALINYKDFYDLENFNHRVNRPESEFYKYLKEQLTQNISELKSMKINGVFCTPLFITFAHHFWNLLCGHAKSFSFAQNLIFNQNCGKNKGFTQIGIEAMNMLLSRETKRRILIDMKHMSVDSRKWFYDFHANCANQGDNFPIVNSHGCVAGVSTLNDFGKGSNNTYYNKWDINLCDDEIKIIQKSDGLIGFILNESRMMGEIPRDIVKEYKKKLSEPGVDVENYKRLIKIEQTRALLRNMFYCVKVCNKKEAWDMICMGSDFDGMIDSLDYLDDVTKYGEIKDLLADDLNHPSSIVCGVAGFNSEQEVVNLMFGYTTDEIIEKIFSKNVIMFLEKYFHDEYLIHGQKKSTLV